MNEQEKRAQEILSLHAEPIPVAVEDGRLFMVKEQDALDAVRSALEWRYENGGVLQWDDASVDAFAMAMKEKMAEARAKGRGGWEDPTQCTAEDLSRMLRDHVEKGDPRDVANFCMMLHQRGEVIE